MSYLSTVIVTILILLFTSILLLIIIPKMRQEYLQGAAPQQHNPTYFHYWDGHRRSVHELLQNLRRAH